MKLIVEATDANGSVNYWAYRDDVESAQFTKQAWEKELRFHSVSIRPMSDPSASL